MFELGEMQSPVTVDAGTASAIVIGEVPCTDTEYKYYMENYEHERCRAKHGGHDHHPKHQQRDKLGCKAMTAGTIPPWHMKDGMTR
jgi:hypothetical protein